MTSSSDDRQHHDPDGTPGSTAFGEASTLGVAPAQDSPGWPGNEPSAGTPSWSPPAVTPASLVRHGPGVPVRVAPPTYPSAPTAEDVWRSGLPAGRPAARGGVRRVLSPTISIILLVASGVVIYLRLHHPPLRVTGAAITQQAKNGCTVDVTGEIGTTGGAGTVSYEWLFQPQLTAPQPLRQSVGAGQRAVYVTAAVEGLGQGSLTQTVTLRVLGPQQASAVASVVVSC